MVSEELKCHGGITEHQGGNVGCDIFALTGLDSSDVPRLFTSHKNEKSLVLQSVIK